MQNDSCYETAAFFFSSHIIVKLRTTSFVIVSSVLRYVAFLGECGRAIASHFRREKKSLSALWRKKRVRPYAFGVWRASLAPQKSAFRSRKFLVEDSSVKFAPFVRSRPDDCKASNVSAVPWKSKS
jgi:hypothetical protein